MWYLILKVSLVLVCSCKNVFDVLFFGTYLKIRKKRPKFEIPWEIVCDYYYYIL